ncbi:MAG: glucose-1-phosphate thymidylyltransferase, partial [Chitinophagaceae bacterium]|nr:glucose-1-phosphate thymidylyltransferase [Chitinophagaceae bacterium]
MKYILFDSELRNRLLPFTHTRPVADIRCGIMTMRERWEYFIQQATGTLTVAYLQDVFPQNGSGDNLFINGAVFATKDLWEHISQLQPQQQLVSGDLIIAARVTDSVVKFGNKIQVDTTVQEIPYTGIVNHLQHNWDIFSFNDKAIADDFVILTAGRTSQPMPGNVMVTGSEQLFIEEGAEISAGCIINASTGPVYIGRNANLLEGGMLRGPIAICEGAVTKMGAKIYGGTTIGPGCKVGGEISNVVFFANSNKGHDGYLGNSVIGEWCNLGADTNCSNLKNNYDAVKIWDEYSFKSVATGLTFCGLLMGDHSKSGINTMFNTGTVVGVSANIYGGNFPEKFVPSFAWGGS